MVTKFAGIALCSALLIGGTLVLATTPLHPTAPSEGPKVVVASTKQPVLPHDKDIRTYLKSVGSFMEVPPRDGRFGASRVPTIHGQVSNSIPGYAQVKTLGAEYDLVSGTVGKHPMRPDESTAKPRMAMVHRVNTTGKYKIFNSIPYATIMAEVSKVAALSPDDVGYAAAVANVDQAKLNIMTHVVKAPDDSCSKCHADTKKGDVVGHVYAAYIENK